MLSEWRIRSYRAGDEALLVDLYARCYGRATTTEHWWWKLISAKPGYESGFLAIRGDRAVGHYGGFPVRLDAEGGRVSALVAVDAMVDAAPRRRDVFAELMTVAHESWAAARVGIALGLPNERSRRRIEPFGWRYLFPLRWLTRPLRPGRILWRKWQRMLREDAGYVAGADRSITRQGAGPGRLPLDAIERTAKALEAEALHSIVRDRAWVRWRFASCPDADYRVLALPDRSADAAPCYGVYRMPAAAGSGKGLIAEVAGPETALREQRRLVREMVRRSKLAGASSAQALAVPGSSPYRTFTRCGFVPRAAAFGVWALILDSSLDTRRLRDPARWRMAGGDFDVV